MVSIRGAIIIDNNTKTDIVNKTKELLDSIIKGNKLQIEQIVSIIFSATKDITDAYPAIAARQLNIKDASLLCVQEMYVEDSVEMCVRVLLHVNKDCSQKNVKHVYMNGAEVLRPDLSN